jgi:hypothetical protein
MFAEFAASVAADAAVIAELIAADELESVEGVVTTVVEVDGVVDVAGGVVVVVVVSSFLLQAAKETAAARVTISSVVFMFLLVLKFDITGHVGTFSAKSPSVRKTWNAQQFQCLDNDYRTLTGFP